MPHFSILRRLWLSGGERLRRWRDAFAEHRLEERQRIYEELMIRDILADQIKVARGIEPTTDAPRRRWRAF